MDINNIGKFIKEKRIEKKLTQQKLGEMLYVTDKAVSKWENGKGLPDITLLKKLAKILDVDVTDILDGGVKNNNKSIDEKIKEIQNEINNKNRRKRKKLITIIIVLLIILTITIFRNINLGYTKKDVYYSHSDKNIKLGVPIGSFFIKNNDRSYKMYNFSSSSIIENETKKYLKSLKYLSCNNTIYYYDEESNISIINYSIKNNILFSTLSYEIVENDYCITNKLEEYTNKLGRVNSFHTLNGGKIDLNKSGDLLEVYFQDGFCEEKCDSYSFKAKMKAMYYKNIENILKTKKVDMEVLEESVGRFEIIDDKLYFFREEIIESKIKLPEVSTFKLKDTNMYLVENYLSNYEKEIVLKLGD